MHTAENVRYGNLFVNVSAERCFVLNNHDQCLHLCSLGVSNLELARELGYLGYLGYFHLQQVKEGTQPIS